MGYKTYRLVTESEADFFNACDAVGLVSNGVIMLNGNGYSMSIINPYKYPTGVTLTTDDGIDYPETETCSKYHVNLRARVDTGLEHLAVDVAEPLQKFSGE